MSTFDFIQNQTVRGWYQKHLPGDIRRGISEYALEKGYCIDENSGLFLRPHFNEQISRFLKATAIDIIFPRPTDWHIHYKMGEALKVLNGGGAYIVGDPDLPERELETGSQVHFHRNTPHAFRPNRNGFLEIELICTEKYDETQEESFTSFSKFQPWVDYF